jgi:hypothetical protein
MSLVLNTGGTGIRFFSAGVTPKAVHWAAFRVIERRDKRGAEYEFASGELEDTLRTVVDRLAAEAEQEPTRWLVVQRREVPR